MNTMKHIYSRFQKKSQYNQLFNTVNNTHTNKKQPQKNPPTFYMLHVCALQFSFDKVWQDRASKNTQIQIINNTMDKKCYLHLSQDRSLKSTQRGPIKRQKQTHT